MSKQDREKVNFLVLVWLWIVNFLSIRKEELPQPPPKELPKDPEYPDGHELPTPDEQKTIKLGIIVGHTKKSPGATSDDINGGESEYDYNSDIADRMYLFCQKKNITPIVIYRDGAGVGIKGAYAKAEEEKCDIVFELHFNSSMCGLISGSEVLCTSFLNDLELAHIVQKFVCKVFQREGLSRGVKAIGRNMRGGFNVHSFPNGANCLVEPFFGSHPKDAALADLYRQEYAECLVNAAEMYAKKLNLL